MKVRRELMMVFQDPYASLNVAKAGRLDHRRGARGPQDRHGRREQGARAGAARRGRPEPRALQPLPARVLGRPAAADRRCPGAGDPAQADRLRRARLGARRVGAGPDPEPAEAAPARLRPDLRLHRPRPRRRPPHLRQRRRHVPRARSSRPRPGRRSTTGPGTRTRAPCSRPCRSRTPTSPAPGKPIVLEGDVPSPINPPSGCRFHPRCPRFQQGVCDVEEPQLEAKDTGSRAACHFPLEAWPMADLRLPADQVAAGT